MELLAVITGLEALKQPGSRVIVYTDSKYVSDAVEKGWVFQWEAKSFRKKKNQDLWVRFLKIYRRHKVNFTWIKGHSNHPENDLCDRLAVEASKGKDLKEDLGYDPDSGDDVLFGQTQ